MCTCLAYDSRFNADAVSCSHLEKKKFDFFYHQCRLQLIHSDAYTSMAGDPVWIIIQTFTFLSLMYVKVRESEIAKLIDNFTSLRF